VETNAIMVNNTVYSNKFDQLVMGNLGMFGTAS
jgi:hypothetical protein